jgi:hypothetical protein
LGQGIGIFIWKKNLIGFHNASFHKFENIQLSFGGFHQPGIIIFLNKW